MNEAAAGLPKEQHFRAAVAGGARSIERDEDRVPWGIIENRPYLRTLGNLALTLTAQRSWREVLALLVRRVRALS